MFRMLIPTAKAIEDWVINPRTEFPEHNGQLMNTLTYFPASLVIEQLHAAGEKSKIQEILQYLEISRKNLTRLIGIYLAITGANIIDATHVQFTLRGFENQTDTGSYLRLIRRSSPIAVEVLNSLYTFGMEREDEEAQKEMRHLVGWSREAPDPPLPLNSAHTGTAIEARRGVAHLVFACLRQLMKMEKDVKLFKKYLSETI